MVKEIKILSVYAYNGTHIFILYLKKTRSSPIFEKAIKHTAQREIGFIH